MPTAYGSIGKLTGVRSATSSNSSIVGKGGAPGFLGQQLWGTIGRLTYAKGFSTKRTHRTQRSMRRGDFTR